MHNTEAFKEIVAARRSVRAFLPQAVDQQTLNSVFETAQRAPSNCNTQPWLAAVASGDVLQALREKVPAAMMQGQISWDFPYNGSYQGVYRDRQYAAANALYSSLGIARDDKAARDGQFFKNFEFFGAPHAVFLFLPACFVSEENSGVREAADLGMYAQTLMLSMVAHGLGSCPQTALSFTAEVIREELGVSEEYKLMFGLSFGYPDPAHPSSQALTDRAELDDCVQFHGK